MEHGDMNDQTPRLMREAYPGYPSSRYSLDGVDKLESLQGIEIPEGPWAINNETPPTAEESFGYNQAGYETDSLGRPLHPWATTLLHPEADGIATGKGAYWHWGPNRTADPIVITDEARPRILLIQRADTGALALPGGFVDLGEDSYDSARREAREETGLTDLPDGFLVYDGPVDDIRTTLHAWPETSAYLFTVEAPSEVEGRDDALDAQWYYIDALPDQLFGSHDMLIKEALAIREKSKLRRLLELPETHRSVTHLQLGHMAYKHYVTEHLTVSAFVKEHDPSLFTDPFREAHAKAYLHKEHQLYELLRTNGFNHIPEDTELIEERALALTNLPPTDGWSWRAPKNKTDEYVKAALEAFEALQQTPYPSSPDFHEHIAPTYQTFWSEGWDVIDDSKLETIRQRILEFAAKWNESNSADAQLLATMLEQLKRRASEQDRNPHLHLAHNDARQSNIAWHPDHGIKLVDWSWADLAPENADATMFLVDMKKSGHAIEPYVHHINHEYLVTLIGFWLAHGITPTRDGSTKVREHQIAAACTAYGMLVRS